MEFAAFERSLADAAPPAGASLAVQALWWGGRGDWDRAHDCAQRGEGDAACDWVHAWLHRQEGDEGNARYWYGRARQAPASGAPEAEWRSIAASLL
jgi:hypothetical protein